MTTRRPTSYALPAARPRRHRGLLAAGLLAATVVPLSGCQAATQPQTSVTCTPGSIVIDLTNVSSAPARYTVTVAIKSAGTTFSMQYSSNTIEAGKSGKVTDSRPDEQETCTVTGVKVFS